ncbi:DsbA family oxidoreductase [Orrella daihaiensis]|uniref:DsbA family oxidoreductase n=1 Tax=Orrella daihaiensis TaxID=2782176 RepID=A0ABY4AI60_9BURK|nr:DsbA family oxidoreductase [Orrella daihaiensis]UOD49971.1 DsbA family oxidoreductase [Orrella daihaiensis]
MNKPVRIDFVSDVACPWCAIGFTTLETALSTVQTPVEVYLQPFELNPDMPEGGQDAIEYLAAKFGISADQVRINQQRIYDRAAQVGFRFHPEGRKRVYNTFHCHRLLHWATTEIGLQAAWALKRELLAAYFTRADDMDNTQTLLDCVKAAGLNPDRAAQVLADDEFRREVRAAQTRYKMLGIQGVPAFILNDKFLVEGAQPVENLIAAIEAAAKRAEQDAQADSGQSSIAQN